ncbi:hypothetical protein HPB51_019057 [Rhipicephalus microplus]|uniref:Transposable element P transposase n=1 Tax=Rhipicephalus microplus TaxID=6941 RepID=A0A9J6D6T3_RHIMP|nr:hypothetical protein HPB51_019057 [Rhipicephalus microplus]
MRPSGSVLRLYKLTSQQEKKKKRAVGGGAPHVFTDLRDDQSCTSDALLVEEVPNSSSRTDQGFVPRTAQVPHRGGLVAKVVEQASENELAASILLEQVKSFQKVKPTWSEVTVRHAVVLRNLSARAYEHIRSSGLLRLPCRSTLERFFGSSRNEVGVTDLIKQRLSAELASHASSQSQTCSLIVDEMRVKQRLLYLKQRDAFVGEVDYGDCLPQKQPGKPEEPVLANSLLCFILSGLSTRYKIPVAYFFTRNCTGENLHQIMMNVLKEVESIGFRIVWIVTDNHQINFLSRDIGKDGEITAQYLEDLYKMQQCSIVKLVRFLTRKHVHPTSMEKMNVRRAVQVVSPPVTAALKLLKEQAGHTCDASFAHVGPTVVFIDTMYRWFTLMDLSNCTQHVHQNNPDSKQYESEDDERLGWLGTSFLDYMAEIKRQSPAKNFLTKETYEVLLITTISNVECVRYLLTATRFRFVLTRKMSSDPIEALFGWLRKSAGSNDQTDVRAVLSGIEKALKSGIACTYSSSNMITADSSSCSSSALLLRSARAAQNDGEAFGAEATTTLEESLDRGKTLLLTPDVAALAMVGGYIARTVHETISCDECFTLVTKPNTSAPSDALIRHQDRGGLLYLSTELVMVLHSLKNYAEVFLARARKMSQPLKAAADNAAEIL